MYKIPISKSEQLTRSSSRNGVRYDYFFVLARHILSHHKMKTPKNSVGLAEGLVPQMPFSKNGKKPTFQGKLALIFEWIICGVLAQRIPTIRFDSSIFLRITKRPRKQDRELAEKERQVT